MKRLLPLPAVLTAAGLLLQAGTPWLIGVLAGAAHGRGATVSEAAEIPLSLALLAAAGPLGLAIAAAGIYLLLARLPSRWSIPAVVLFGLPALVSASVFARALLIFLGMA